MADTTLEHLKQNTSNHVAPPSIYNLLSNPRVEKAIAAVAGKYLTPDRFLRLSINAIKKTPLLLECDPQSVLGSFMTSAALGLEPNTIQQQAFLIPYKKTVKIGDQWVKTYECQFQIGYRGFITLSNRSPNVLRESIKAETIHENDLFDYMMGSESFLNFKMELKSDRGNPIGAFCYTRHPDGIEKATVIPLTEIYKIRSKSETYNALLRNVENASNDKERAKEQKKFDETPWVMWFDDMAAKSVIKKHAKQLALVPGDPLSAGAELDNDSEDRVIDMSAMTDPDVVIEVVKNGYEPPMLEHQEAQTIPTDIRQPEHEPVMQPAKSAERSIESDGFFGGIE